MKSLVNDKRISCAKVEDNSNENGKINNCQQRLQQIIDENLQNQTYLKSLQQQIHKLTKQNAQLDLAIADHKNQYDQLLKQVEEQQKQQGQQQHQMEMQSWIQQVQKYTGVSQNIIDSLLTIQYQGSPDQQQICLSCYQNMVLGSKCKYLPCAHIFHAQCIDNHLKLNKMCPACGQQVI